MIVLGIAGKNLTIKAITGSENEKIDKNKILNELKGISKIPIYKSDTFLHFEIDKSAIYRIYEIWSDKEIVVDKRAQPVIDQFKFNSIPLKDLMYEDVEIQPANPDYQYNEVQQEICSIDHNKKSLAIFLDTGAGKALACIGRLANLGFKKALVFSQLDNLSDWEAHIRIMYSDSKSYIIYDGGTAAKRKKIDLSGYDFILTNHEKARELVGRTDLNYDSIVIDELHCVSNPGTQGFKNANILAKKAEIKIGMTATPLEESLEPLWGALHILNPQLAGNKDEFLNKYQEVLHYMEKKYTRNGREMIMKIPTRTRVRNLPELQKLLSTIMYRKSVAHTFKFEDRTKIIEVDITNKQRQLYEQIVDEILFELSAKTFYTENPLQKTLRLLQAADGLYNLEFDNHESAKLEYLKQELDKSDDKIIIWSRFRPITEILGKLYSKDGVVYNGKVQKGRKKLHKLAFQGCRDNTELEEYYKLLNKYPDFSFREPGTANKLFITYSQRSGAGMNLNSCRKQIACCVGESGRAFKQAMGRIKRFDTQFDTIDTEIMTTRGTIEKTHTIKTLDKIRKAGLILDGKDSVLDTKIREIISLIQNPMINELG